MTDDERAIRDFVTTWLSATRAGDLPTVLSLMADDAVFMVPGREPFGKQEFAAGFGALKEADIESNSDIRELQIVGAWAYMRSHLQVTMTPRGGGPVMRRVGYTLTILRRENGKWLLARDANLLTAQ